MKNILLICASALLFSCGGNSYCNCEHFIEKICIKQGISDVKMGKNPSMLSWFGVAMWAEELAATEKEKECAKYIMYSTPKELNEWIEGSYCYNQTTITNSTCICCDAIYTE